MKSLDQYGYILVAKDDAEAIQSANEIASEHLEIVMKKSIRSYDEDPAMPVLFS